MQYYRRSPQQGFNFNGGLIIDSFAGGGGASMGTENAFGFPVDIAVNHDEQAIRMHKVNHPTTNHYCESVWSVDPLEVTKGQRVRHFHASPDCRHHSVASGGKPKSKRVRGLAWMVLKWAGLVRPDVITLENVPEFLDWGPLTRSGRPCKRRKGMTFDKFERQLRDLGYAVEWETLTACDYGVPTSRKRLFMVARCDGLPIVWPKPTHGPGLLPYKTAADIIDWSIPCPSIFERKKPYAEKTLARIAKGIQKFVIEANEPFIVPRYGERKGQSPRTHSIYEPLPTIVPTGNHGNLVVPFLAKHFGGVTGVPFETPVPTITTKACQTQIVASSMVKLRGTSKHGAPVTEPVHTITAGGIHHYEVRSFLTKYNGKSIGQTVNDPLHTITTKDPFGVVTIKGDQYQIVDIGMRALTPRELYRAQGFPDDYVIDVDCEGEKISLTEQRAKCGNSVCPPVMEALVRANFPEINQAQRAA